MGERLAYDAGDWSTAPSSPERKKPLEPQGGLVALFGNLAPQGAILKRSAADANLFEHEGRAVVFSSLADLAARIDDPKLDVEANDILVLQNAGPHSESAMPEAGYLPIPKKLAAKGVKDMVRVSDARMSGTAFGTIVLHVTPDAPPAGRSAWCATATASGSRSNSAASICWSTMRNSKSARRSSNRRSSSPRAVTPGFISRKCSAPTRVAISLFSSRAERCYHIPTIAKFPFTAS